MFILRWLYELLVSLLPFRYACARQLPPEEEPGPWKSGVPFRIASLPPELRIRILEELDTLADLRAALLASKALYQAYLGSPVLVKQRVFHKSVVGRHHESWDGPFARARRIYSAHLSLQAIERRNAAATLDFRIMLWHDVIDLYLTMDIPMDVFFDWSKDQAKGYRLNGRETEACDLEMRTFELLARGPDPNTVYGGRSFIAPHLSPMNRSEGPIIAIRCLPVWLHFTFSGARGRFRILHCLSLFQRVWDYMVHDRRQPAHGLVALLTQLLDDAGHWGCRSEFQDCLAMAWSWLHQCARDRHAGGLHCVKCYDCGQNLTQASRSVDMNEEQILSYREDIWNNLPPRSSAFNAWTRLIIESYTLLGRKLDGYLRVWERLQIQEYRPLVPKYDLEWARNVLTEMLKLGRRNEALTFQASVLSQIPEPSAHHYAWASSLVKAYVSSKRLRDAVELQESVWERMDVNDKLYHTCGHQLADLYEAAGRSDDANDVKKLLLPHSSKWLGFF